ncbi:MAG: magnesium/cobalt transporter CorA [Marinilabiliaceae bacterium]|nr:magnesium/cobalt transporter CorA [Marinilabiliaceae bacterium]
MRKQSKKTPRHTNKNLRSQKTGLPPGSVVYIGPQRDFPPMLHQIQFDAQHIAFEELKANDLGVKTQPNKTHTSWLHLTGIHDTHMVQAIGKRHHIYSLTLEDICNTEQRPKAETHDNYLYVTLKAINYNPETEQLDTEQLSLILGVDFLITFREKNDDSFMPLMERLRNSSAKIRQRGHDYLMYCLLDLVVDNYFSVVEAMSDRTEELEEMVNNAREHSMMGMIQQNKKTLLQLRRLISPVREAIHTILKDGSDYLDTRNEKYYQDIYDHVFHMTESIDNLLEMNNGLKDLHLSFVNLKMNQIIQILTVFTAIFTPLTFIVGLYGMNFQYMPELTWRYGYFAVWGLMLLIVIGLLIYLKHKRWLR